MDISANKLSDADIDRLKSEHVRLQKVLEDTVLKPAGESVPTAIEHALLVSGLAGYMIAHAAGVLANDAVASPVQATTALLGIIVQTTLGAAAACEGSDLTIITGMDDGEPVGHGRAPLH